MALMCIGTPGVLAQQREIDFNKDVKPILIATCVECHGQGRAKGDFRIDTRDSFIKGGESGAAAVAGDSAKSLVVKMVSGIGVEEDLIMPKKGRRLTEAEVVVMRAWIDQGMKWPDGFTFAAKVQPLAPRRVEVGGAGNPVDVLIAKYESATGRNGESAKKGVVDDRVFARRVFLDVIGLLPSTEELEKFVADRAPDKREKLVWGLLNDNRRYTEHWLSFWNDLLRNDYKGTGYIDGGRKQITPWLYSALAGNMPFDQFVRELVTGANGSEGFIKGIVWRGVVNAAQTPQMQAAQNISQVFMGANLKCASCHDSFVSQWKLEDAYGLAGIYADKPLEMERCGAPLGKSAKMKFLYPELGSIDETLPRDQRLKQLADLITSEKNGRLTRTIVNRLWKKFMGRGIVEPVDEMENDPWDRDLLDWLAQDLADNKYDLKKTMARILTSRAYQLPVVAQGESGNEQFVFRGPVVKRLTAEQFVDCLSQVSGSWGGKAAFNPNAPAAKLPHNQSRWIWSSSGAAKSAPPGKVYFRKEVELDNVVSGEVMLSADNEFVLYVNGKRVASGEEWSKPVWVDLKPHLASNGKNVIAVEAANTTAAANPAGLFVCGQIKHRKVSGSPAVNLASDATWSWSEKPGIGWDTVGFDGSSWKAAVVLGDVKMAPWKLDQKLTAGVAVAAGPEVRSALCAADPLVVALGRTNREQVLTDREKTATTLQALEMSNGATLAEMLKRGAAKLSKEGSAEEIVAKVYTRAMGRLPTAGELATAVELVGSPVRVEGVEDLLWIVAMLPEFQLIR